MSIQVTINGVDCTSIVQWESLLITQNITNEVDNASFVILKYGTRSFVPAFQDEVKIYDGATQVFGGIILRVVEIANGSNGLSYNIECADYTVQMDTVLVAQTYENETVKEILTNIFSLYASAFNTNNVVCDFNIAKIVFNQVPVSECIKKLAELVNYDWYMDYDKSLHFFSKDENFAPFNLTDISANYVYESLERNIDNSQVVNRVKVRGGEYDSTVYADKITVSGNDTKSFILPYRYANIVIMVNSISKTVGIDFIDTFPSKDVLYNYQEKTIKFENALSNGDIIEYSGNPKVRVFAIAEDSESVANYGVIEKLIRDDTIKDNSVARRRAAAELFSYANSIIDTRFETRNSGLRAGQKISLTSSLRGCADEYIIKRLTFKPIDPENFGYKAECISGKRYDLLSILAKILAPKALDMDDIEVSEQIYLDQGEVTITEENEIVTPSEDTATLSVVENNLVSDVEPTWVVGVHTPSSQSDVKRQGRISLSFKTY